MQAHTHTHPIARYICVQPLRNHLLHPNVIKIYINMFQYNTQLILFDQICMLMLKQSLACPVVDKMKSMRNRVSNKIKPKRKCSAITHGWSGIARKLYEVHTIITCI